MIRQVSLGGMLMHFCESQWPQTRLYLDVVDADPGCDQAKDASHQIHKLDRVIVAIQALLPKLVQPCATDDQRGIHLHRVPEPQA